MEKKVLVKGYMRERAFGDPMETLFAVYPDGTITTCTRKYSNSFFNEECETWEVISELPSNVKYIGQYKMVSRV